MYKLQLSIKLDVTRISRASSNRDILDHDHWIILLTKHIPVCTLVYMPVCLYTYNYITPPYACWKQHDHGRILLLY